MLLVSKQGWEKEDLWIVFNECYINHKKYKGIIAILDTSAQDVEEQDNNIHEFKFVPFVCMKLIHSRCW